MAQRQTSTAAAEFLSPKEWECYSLPDRRLGRSLTEIDPLSGKSEKKGELVQELRHRWQSRARRAERSGRTWFWCSLVGVQVDDGMSWSSEAVAQMVHRSFGHFHLVTLSAPSAEALPVIVGLLKPRPFFRRVVQLGLTRGFLPFRPWYRYLLWAAAAVLTLLVKISDITLSQHLGAFGAAATVFDLALAFSLFAAASLLLQEVMIRLSTSDQRQEVRELRAAIEDARTRDDPAYWKLVEAVVGDMGRRPFPRAVVVDDFHSLDPLSQDVLRRYLETASRQRAGSEEWVVFELWNSGLSQQLAVDVGGAAILSDHCTVYRQLPLDAQQRRQLAETIGRTERSHFPTVKQLCRPDDAQQRLQYGDLLQAYRLERPKRPGHYDEVDLLYLLVLNAQGRFEDLEHDFVRKELSGKKGLLAELLRGFLEGAELTKEELDRVLRRAVDGFIDSPFLTLKKDGNRRILSLHATGGFEAVAGDLQLPPAALGHAFWCVFWWNRLQGTEHRAAWVRKLAFHLLHSDPAVIPVASRADFLERTTLALLYVLEGAVQTCVYSVIPELLELAALRAESEVFAARDGIRKRLRAACWNAYAVLGSELGLAAYLRTLPPAQGRLPDDPLSELFLAETPLGDEERSRLAQLLAVSQDTPGDRDLSPTYARQRATALLLSLEELMQSADGLGLREITGLARETLMEDAAGLEQRLTETPAAELGLTDLLSLRWLLDNLGQVARSAGRPIDLLVELLKRDSAGPGVPEALREEMLKPLDRLIGLAEVAVLLAQQMNTRLRRSLGAQLVRAALIRDLGAVAMINLRLTLQALGPAGVEGIGEERFARLRGIVEVVMEAAGIRVDTPQQPADLTSPQLSRQIEQLGSFATFVFHQFDLASQALLAEARRTSLVLRTGDPAERWSQSEPLRIVLDESEDVEPLVAILAYLTLADCFSSSAELRSDFLLQATGVVLSEPFGSDLKRDFCLLAIQLGHHLDTDLTPVVHFLVEHGSAGGGSLIDDHLQNPRVDAEAAGLCLVNLARRVPERLREALFESLQRVAAGDGDQGASITRLLALERLEDELKQRPEDGRTDEILDQWEEWRDSWHYASLLLQLLHVAPTDRVVSETLAVLGDTEPPSSYSVHPQLAVSLARHLDRSGRRLQTREQPLAFLSAAIRHWENRFPAPVNAAAYRILYRTSELQPAELLEKVTEWERIRLQHEEVAEVLPLLRQKSYLRLFLYYVDFFEEWGLPFDLPSGELAAERARPAAERQARIHAWLQDGARLASLLTETPDGPAVCARLLLVGEELFRPPLLLDEDYAEVRRRFDWSARRDLVQLFALARSLAVLPAPLQALLRAHEQRFESFALPSGGPA